MFNIQLLHCRWSEEVVWQQGSLVRHNQCLYKAEGVSNVAEPGKNADKMFYVRMHLTLYSYSFWKLRKL